mgnify:FL=1
MLQTQRPAKALIAILLLNLLIGCNNDMPTTKAVIPTVRLATITANDNIVKRRFTGRVEAISTVDLSFQVPGKITQLSAQEGTFISKGDLIAALDEHDYRLAVERASAQFKLAKLDVKRKRNLQRSGSLPKAALDQAETNFQLSRVALETAKQNLSYTKIIAPFDALISTRLIDNHANVGAYQAIVRVQALTELRVHIHIPEDLVPLLEQTDNFNAVAVFKDRPTQRFPIQYREHITEAGNVAQTYEVIFGLSREQNEHVLPGMTVAVIISKKNETSSADLNIPISALDYDTQGSPRVWIFKPQEKIVVSQNIRLSTRLKKNIIVLEGISVGDQIVTAGAHLLRNNMPVRPFISY